MKAMTAAKTVLVCAATRWEAPPLARALAGRARVLRTGIGPANAERALAAESGPFSWVLSSGLCGALQPGMGPGDLVLDLQGAPAELPPAARELAASLGLKLHFGRILHSDRVLGPAEKAEAGRRERACAVDMESAAVRAWAQQRDLPFLAVRVVLDGLADAVPGAAPEGEDAASLLRFALSRPLELPLLLKTGVRSASAMRGLAAFLPRFLEAL